MPATVGLDHAIVLVVATVTVINDVLCALSGTTVYVYTMSVAVQYIEPDNVNKVLTELAALATATF
jgi:hypothetical protein